LYFKLCPSETHSYVRPKLHDTINIQYSSSCITDDMSSADWTAVISHAAPVMHVYISDNLSCKQRHIKQTPRIASPSVYRWNHHPIYTTRQCYCLTYSPVGPAGWLFDCYLTRDWFETLYTLLVSPPIGLCQMLDI